MLPFVPAPTASLCGRGLTVKSPIERCTYLLVLPRPPSGLRFRPRGRTPIRVVAQVTGDDPVLSTIWKLVDVGSSSVSAEDELFG
jgi:hypothetical protein